MKTMAHNVRERASRLARIGGLYRTDTGKKYAMAVSGAVLLAFVLGHMIGNLHAFEGGPGGAPRIDEYAEGLRELGEPLFPRTMVLWVFFRLPLTAAFLVHIHAAWALTRSNRAARGVKYQSPRSYLAANYASRTMRWSGVIVLLFLLWHLADLTWGVEAVNPDFRRGEVYHNLVSSLSRWPVWILYAAAQGALALHVWHGAWSLFQSIGVNNPRFNRFRRIFAGGFAAAVTGGFLAVPVGVALDVIR